MKCQLVTWEQVEQLAYSLASQLKKDNYAPEVVVGISRGGVIPARLLCDKLRIHDLVVMKMEHWGVPGRITGEAAITHGVTANIAGKRVLVVDDLTDTGDSLRKAAEHVKSLKPREARTAVLHHKATSAFTPDYYGEKLDGWAWVIYPWMRHEDTADFVKKAIEKGVTRRELSAFLKKEHDLDVKEDELDRIVAEVDG